MQTFFIPSENISGHNAGDFALVTGEVAAHLIRALRVRRGEEIILCPAGLSAEGAVLLRARIVEITGFDVKCEVVEALPPLSEPPYFIRLFMGLPKGDKFEFIVEKAVELGVSEIIPFDSEFTVAAVDEKSLPKKLLRWNKIAESAASQCGRATLPRVLPPIKFAAAAREAAASELPLFCNERERESSLKHALILPNLPKSVSVTVGAEGGFSEREAALAVSAGLRSVSLGRRILRCETAPIFALSVIAATLEE